MNSLHLSHRLAKVAEYVPKNSRVADIGSDHAYLLVNLFFSGKLQYGIAGEISKGPFLNSCSEINNKNLNGIIIPRLANGLEAVYREDNIDTITICGMGGKLITSILEKDTKNLLKHSLLILQPNVGSFLVRKWLFKNNYKILNENILEEDNRIYEILVACYSNDRIEQPSFEDLFFGKELRIHQNDAFKKKWNREFLKNHNILSKINKSKRTPISKINYLISINNCIKEVLQNGKIK